MDLIYLQTWILQATEGRKRVIRVFKLLAPLQGKQSFLNKLAYFFIIFDVIIFDIIIFEVIIFDVITFDIIILMSFLIGKLFKPGFI